MVCQIYDTPFCTCLSVVKLICFCYFLIGVHPKPMLLVLAGPNGSGKSTITTFFDKVGKYTNADDVVATTGMDNREAAVLVDKMRYESINKKEDFTFETLLSSEYKLNILKKAKEEGYFKTVRIIMWRQSVDA